MRKGVIFYSGILAILLFITFQACKNQSSKEALKMSREELSLQPVKLMPSLMRKHSLDIV